uniref:TIMELESS-interacting protein n=1 Tax=Bursaphelenchus xylophilus TaxID=6326 RepID=A0A1I7S1F8_BURXY
MDYDEYGDYDDENDFMDVEEAIEVPDKKAKKSDVVDILNDLADGEGKDGLKKGRVEPKVRKPMGSRIFLTERRLTAPTGIRALINSFKGYKPRTGGKNPYADLKDIMKKMELWAHSVAPNMEFNDFIARAQTLGRKRAVTVWIIQGGASLWPDLNWL